MNNAHFDLPLTEPVAGFVSRMLAVRVQMSSNPGESEVEDATRLMDDVGAFFRAERFVRAEGGRFVVRLAQFTDMAAGIGPTWRDVMGTRRVQS